MYREIMWHSLQSVPYSDNRSPILFHKVGNRLVFAGWGVSGCAATIVRVKTPITPPATRSAEPALASPRTTASRLGAEGWLIATGVAVAGAVLRILMLALFAHANDDATRGLLTKWDARYYLAIAEHGYFPDDLAVDGPVHHYTMAFFPGYPFLVRAVTWLGVPPLVAAVLVSIAATVALAGAAMALAARLRPQWRDNRAAQTAAAVVVTSAPMAIVFAMPYTEALFGALCLWALVALCDRRWLLAGLLTAAAAATRLTAVDLIAAFAVTVLMWGRTEWRAWAGLVISPLPLVGYLAWANAHLGDVGGYFGTQQEHWNSSFDFGVSTVKWVWTQATTADNAGYLLSCLAIVAAPLLLAATWRRVPWPVWLFVAALIANVLLSDGIMHSRPRLLLPAVVLAIPYVAQAVTGPRRVRRGAWCAVAAWVLFGAWFSAYMLAVFEWAI